MLDVSEEIRLHRKSGPTSLFLHIPYLNYLFFFFQGRGAYNVVKNYYEFHREVPKFFSIIWLTVKFSLFSTVASMFFFSLLLVLGYNPFSQVLGQYLLHLGTLIGGLINVEHMTFLFAKSPMALYFASFSGFNMGLIAFLTFGTYVLFGLCGAFLAAFNIRADLKRAQFV